MGLQHESDWQDHEQSINYLEKQTEELNDKMDAIDNFLIELSGVIETLRRKL